MDQKQQQAFAEAVERKKQEALEASQQKLDEPATTQDDPTPRQKSSRHGQVTAENWNQ
jgi:hypothetical protein